MNEVSDMYNKRLLEYADRQEMFNIKEYGFQFFVCIENYLMNTIELVNSLHLILLVLVYLVLKLILYKMKIPL